LNADLSRTNLTNAQFYGATFDGADLRGADLRGAMNFVGTGAITNNLIDPNGYVNGLVLVDEQTFHIRDYDGDLDRQECSIDWGCTPTPVPELPVVIQSQMMLGDLARLTFVFEADPWHSVVAFEPNIPVQLGGMLELTFIDDADVATQVGRTFRIFDWTGVEPTGAFTVASRYPWDLDELYTAGEVTLLLPGDTNADGTVDIQDLNNVHNNFGGAGLGDTNNDGTIDIVDLNNVRNFFGTTAPQAVPEPATVGLLLIGLALFPARRLGRDWGWSPLRRRSGFPA